MHTPSSLVAGETASPDFAVEQAAAGGERVTGRPAISVVRRRDFAAVLRRRAGLLAVCALAAVLGGARLGDEGYVSLHGDMPKFLMNGVFLLDMARDLPFSGVDAALSYAEHYYARYPALSLGHHPPLLPLAEVPMFAIFGVSVAAARLVGLIAMIVAVGLLYRLVEDLYGRWPAVAAAVFFATSPQVVILARSVLAEILTLALVMGSVYCLHRFCEAGRRSALVGFVVCAALSLYAKQLAIFVFPAYLALVSARLGPRRLFQRDMVLAAVAIVVVALPLVPVTLLLSPANVDVVRGGLGDSRVHYLAIVRLALQHHFAIPVLLLAGVGGIRAAISADRRSWLFLCWVASVLAGLLLAGVYEPVRYSVYWVPALSALAGSSLAGLKVRPGIRTIAIIVMVIAAGVQGRSAFRVALPAATGYEEAARFVLASNPGGTVMFSGDIDTGFFTFFVRKHDAARRLVVLRADKLLTTSRMALTSVEDRIERPEQIYDMLRTFGTRFVVIEDSPSHSHVLEWLRTETRTPQFQERRRIPIGTTDPRLRGVDLVVYEFLGATAAAPDAILSIRMPLVSRSMAIKLTDLTGGQ